MPMMIGPLSVAGALRSAAITGMTISPGALQRPTVCAVIFVSPTHFSIANAERVCAVQPKQLHPGRAARKLARSRGLVSIVR
jgi:hypothetical protein